MLFSSFYLASKRLFAICSFTFPISSSTPSIWVFYDFVPYCCHPPLFIVFLRHGHAVGGDAVPKVKTIRTSNPRTRLVRSEREAGPDACVLKAHWLLAPSNKDGQI